SDGTIDPTWTQLQDEPYATALAALEDYNYERILPLRVDLIDTPLTYVEARGQCRDSIGDEELRLPTKQEIALLAPTLGYGSLRSGRTVWVLDNECPLSAAAVTFA